MIAARYCVTKLVDELVGEVDVESTVIELDVHVASVESWKDLAVDCNVDVNAFEVTALVKVFVNALLAAAALVYPTN